jgi:hypothetical protein
MSSIDNTQSSLKKDKGDSKKHKKLFSVEDDSRTSENEQNIKMRLKHNKLKNKKEKEKFQEFNEVSEFSDEKKSASSVKKQLKTKKRKDNSDDKEEKKREEKKDRKKGEKEKQEKKKEEREKNECSEDDRKLKERKNKKKENREEKENVNDHENNEKKDVNDKPRMKKNIENESSSDKDIVKLKRFKINTKNLIKKKTIYIVNKNLETNISFLSKVLYNINKIDNIDNIYSNNVRFIINTDDKKEYKKILLEYPYLFFNTFNFNKSSKSMIDDKLKMIYVIDYDFVKQDDALNHKISKIIERDNDKIQFIFMTTDFNNTGINDETNWKETILFHDLDNLKSIQKLFYRKIVKNCDITTPEINDWDEYKQILSDNDVKCVVITENQLRFN